VEDEVGVPPGDRVRRVHHVEHPGALPGAVHRRCRLSWVEGEAHGAAVPEAWLDLGAARIPVVQEGPEVLVEARGTGEHGAAESVGHVELTAEGRLGAVGPQALTERVETRTVVLRELAPPLV